MRTLLFMPHGRTRGSVGQSRHNAIPAAGRGVLVLLVLLVLANMGAVSAAPPATLSHYDLEARFDPAQRTITGTLVLDWRNGTGLPQDSFHSAFFLTPPTTKAVRLWSPPPRSPANR